MNRSRARKLAIAICLRLTMKEKPPPKSDAPEPESAEIQLAGKLSSLKSSTLRAISRRERLPQPLFWSLFHTEVNAIKERRKEKRRALAALFNVDWL